MTEQATVKVRGFQFASLAAGLKKSGKPDLALILSEVPAACAGVFTTNRVVAAPLQVTEPRIRAGRCQAVLVNSGNANACTGEPGLRDARRCGELAAHALGLPEELVAVASTGVIGLPLPMPLLEAQIPRLADGLDQDGAEGAARAIMTTDAFPKVSHRTGSSAGASYTVLGIAKGAGMIHPQMATMLAFLVTDARVGPDLLDAALRAGTDRSFNRITVDRDTSTNDLVLLLANGRSEGPEIVKGSAEAEVFCGAVEEVMYDLARMIVRDGEGATKVVRIEVQGAASDADALLAARSIATSALVKTAFFGEDANWGRIIAAAGYSGAEVDPGRVEIRFGDVPVVRGGVSTGGDLEARATNVLKQEEFTVTVDLGLGRGRDFYLTSDLTYDYVKINAAYRT